MRIYSCEDLLLNGVDAAREADPPEQVLLTGNTSYSQVAGITHREYLLLAALTRSPSSWQASSRRHPSLSPTGSLAQIESTGPMSEASHRHTCRSKRPE